MDSINPKSSQATQASTTPTNAPLPESMTQGELGGLNVREVMDHEHHFIPIHPDNPLADNHELSQHPSPDSIEPFTDSATISPQTASSHASSPYNLPAAVHDKEHNAIPNLKNLLQKAEEEEKKGNDGTAYLHQLTHDCYVEILSHSKNGTPRKDQENTSELFRSAIKYANVAMEEIKVAGEETEAVKDIILSATYLFQAGKEEQKGALALAEAYHNLATSYYYLAAATKPSLGEHVPERLGMFQKASTPNKGLIIYWKQAVAANLTKVESLLDDR
jgi:hypothetical protein